MAIKVGGTSVIDNSRNLQNIASVDATTLAAFTTAGMGDITSVTAGSGLTGGGTSGAVTINHQDTSSQGSVNNSGNTVVQDITLDTYGHITGINSTTVSTGASTTYGAVGTYIWASRYSGVFAENSTVSGSSIQPAGFIGTNTINISNDSYVGGNMTKGSSTLSGTWRVMGRSAHLSSNATRQTLMVRIS